MRYIEKKQEPPFFIECKKGLPENSTWESFSENQELSQCKKKLKQELLQEQAGLCIYCERSIQESNSHLEHIYPKDGVSGYPERTFNYSNLVVSCNGDQCSIDEKERYEPDDVHSCGHKKANRLDTSLFLDPTTYSDIQTFFAYDKTACSPISSGKDCAKANYTIDLLHLNNPRLNNERENARIALQKALIQKTKSPIQRKCYLTRMLEKDRAFISFLRYCFAPILSSDTL